jgi:hypothetical protein
LQVVAAGPTQEETCLWVSYTSYLYPAEQAPKYLPANIANIIFACACMFFSSLHRFRLGRLNKQLDRAEVVDMQAEGVAIGTTSKKLLNRLQIGEFL